MEEIQEQLERIIDDIERDSQLTRDEILLALNILKAEIEDYTLGHGESSLDWDDLV